MLQSNTALATTRGELFWCCAAAHQDFILQPAALRMEEIYAEVHSYDLQAKDAFRSLLVQLLSTHDHEVMGLQGEVSALREKVAELEHLKTEFAVAQAVAEISAEVIEPQEIITPNASSHASSAGRVAPYKGTAVLPSTPLGLAEEAEDAPLSEWQSPLKTGKNFILPESPDLKPLDLSDSTAGSAKTLGKKTGSVIGFQDEDEDYVTQSQDTVHGLFSSDSRKNSRTSRYTGGSVSTRMSAHEAAWQAHSTVCFEHDNWRRFVVVLLENASRELYQLKTTWCQSEHFLNKAKRGGHGHHIDLLSKNAGQIRNQVTKTWSGQNRKSRMSISLRGSAQKEQMRVSTAPPGDTRRTLSWPVPSRNSANFTYAGSSSVQQTDSCGSYRGIKGLSSRSFALNPSSPGRIVWSLCGLVLMIYDLVMLPMQVFDLPDEPAIKVFSWSAQIYWTMDIIISFITGIYVKTELEMRINVIARYYLMTWFPIDVIITVPLWFVLIMDVDSSAEAGRGLKSARYVRMLRFLRLARLMKAEHLLGEALELLNSTTVLLTLGIVKLMICMVLCNHVVACLWYAVGRTKQGKYRGWALEDKVNMRSIEYKYFTAMHWTLTQFQGTSEIEVGGTLQERAYAVWTVLFALIMLAIFVSGLTNMMMQLQSLASKRTHESRVVRGYLNNHKVSKALSLRIKKHIAWKQRQQRRTEHDAEVSKLLPQQLMMDLLDEVRSPLICQHHFFFFKFREAYPFVVRRLCHEAINPVAPTPGEHIFSPSDAATKMYFLVSGQLLYTAIYHAHRKTFRRNNQSGEQKGEMGSYSITDGQYLSEPVLWTNWEHAGELQVINDAQMLSLQAERFEECVKSGQTSALASATLYARRFLACLNRFGKNYTDFIPPDEILVTMLEEEESDDGEVGTDSHHSNNGVFGGLMRSAGKYRSSGNGGNGSYSWDGWNAR